MTTHKNTASRLREIRKNNFMDHAGFSTYESIYRAKEIFGANKMVTLQMTVKKIFKTTKIQIILVDNCYFLCYK